MTGSKAKVNSEARVWNRLFSTKTISALDSARNLHQCDIDAHDAVEVQERLRTEISLYDACHLEEIHCVAPLRLHQNADTILVHEMVPVKFNYVNPADDPKSG